jgi:hypothetical protein
MTATQLQGEKAFKSAEEKFRLWAAGNGMRVHHVLPMAFFEESNPQSLIYVFFPSDSDLESYRQTRKLHQAETCYRKFLIEALFPEDRFPVTFIFDSHQNVQESFGGNYFDYLR